jgi:hypothetical protein
MSLKYMAFGGSLYSFSFTSPVNAACSGKFLCYIVLPAASPVLQGPYSAYLRVKML